MIIAQISDTHLTLDTPDANQRMRNFALTIADINALDPPPQAIVHTGDIVHNGRRDEYAEAAAILAAARAPVYVLAGNKDDRANLRAAFAAGSYLTPGSGFVDYAVEDFSVRLIALDTLSPGNGKGEFRSEQVKDLIDRIDVETTKPIAVFTHHPPFEVTVGPDRLHFETPESMSRLRDALQRRVQRPCSSCGRRSCRGHLGKRGAVHRDDATQGRVSTSHEDAPGLSRPSVRSGVGLYDRNAHCRVGAIGGSPAKDRFDCSRIRSGRLTNRREGTITSSIGRINYSIDRTTEISFSFRLSFRKILLSSSRPAEV